MKKQKLQQQLPPNFYYFKINEPVYDRLFYIFVGDKKELFKAVKKIFKSDISSCDVFNGANGCMFEMTNEDGCNVDCMWFGEPTFYIVAHECFHAVNRTLYRAGIKLCRETNEVYAYYTGWIINAVCSELIKKSICKV